MVLLLWLLAPGLRRVVDWNSQFQQSSTIIGLPAALSLWVAVLNLRRLAATDRDVTLTFTVVIVAVGYATAVGVVISGVVPAVTGALTWLGPLAVGLAVLTTRADDAQLRRAIGRTAVVGALVCRGPLGTARGWS